MVMPMCFMVLIILKPEKETNLIRFEMQNQNMKKMKKRVNILS